MKFRDFLAEKADSAKTRLSDIVRPKVNRKYQPYGRGAQTGLLKSIFSDTATGMFNAGKEMWSGMDTLDKAALTTSPIPIVGDAVGAANDLRYLAKEPTLANAGLAGLGLLPFVPSLGMVKAYHGTPHNVDKFRMDKIGTGEGAQVYGHGLYFSENPEVAGQYQKAVGRPVRVQRDGKWFLETTQGQSVAGPFQREIQAATAAKDYQGNLYDVNIDVNHEDLLDWDKPLSEQGEAIQIAIKQHDAKAISGYTGKEIPGWGAGKPAVLSDGDPTGAQLYARLQGLGKDAFTSRESGVQASNALREMGIPGIRYLDQGSRGTKEGTRNLVIFDDNLIKINK